MGLAIVELVMAVEQSFGVSLPRHSARSIGTVGELLELVRARSDPAHWNEERAQATLRQLVVEQLGVRAEQVTLDAHLINDLGAG